MRTMRVRWVGAAPLAVALMGGAAGPAIPGPAVVGRPAAVTWSARSVSGGERLSLQDSSEVPFSRPLLRLAILPLGAREPRVSVARGPGAVSPPAVEVTALRPMTMRGLRLLPILVRPRAASGAAAAPVAAPAPAGPNERPPDRLELELCWTGGGALGRDAGEAAAAAAAGARTDAAAAAGAAALLALLPQGTAARAAFGAPDEGGYLIITAPELASAVEPLAAWKRETGLATTVVTTDETGQRNDEIQAYVRAVYASGEPPPRYLLLVGDVEQVPGFDYHQSVSDLPYALVDGDDFLPDLQVGRLSARTSDEADTIIAKLLGYEQDPYLDDPDWFSRALLVAGNYSSSTPVPVSRWCREQLSGIGYAEVDSVFYPPNWSTGPPLIKAAIDRGVSLISYRGWAYGWRGWEPPKFTVDHIPGLANGRMLPAVFSFVCLNNDFTQPECFGEAWIRAGSASEPRGAVAFIGNSEHWSHTRFNDAAAIGAFSAIGEQGARRLGDILDAAKFGIMEQFGEQLYYEDFTDESVEFYFHIYSLLGDPGLELSMGTPRAINVAHATSIPAGGSYLEVRVREADGVTPVAGARVGLSRDGAVLACARTDAAGNAELLADFAATGGAARITVTGRGLVPYRGSATVASGGPYLALEPVTVRDDGSGASSGNGDGTPNPGEVLELDLRLANQGGSTASGVTATLEALAGATVEVAQVSFPDIASGATAAALAPCVVRLASDAEDGLRARLRLVAVAGADTSLGAFELVLAAPALAHAGAALAGDGVLDPDESAALTVSLRNSGSIASGGGNAVLRAATPALATVTDSLSTFPALASGATADCTPPFTIEAAAEAAVGQAAVFTLLLTSAEGYESQTSFSLIIGAVDARAPFGPDTYGYYAYDSGDTDYPDAVPLYEWIRCSTAYGGAGTRIDLADNSTAVVELPFNFVYYGQSYDRLLVCDNGWAAFDTTASFDFYNWSMPNLYGNGAQLAPFWDNLDPDKEFQGTPVGDGIYALDDDAGGRFVVEWSRLGNLRSQHDNHQDYDDLQTFELVLYDPVRYPTPTGDGRLRFQYKQVVNNDSERMYATVGIENEAENDGLEYSYFGAYPPPAAPLSAGLAIEFSTVPPRYSPFRLARFRAAAGTEGVELSWEPVDSRRLLGYRVYRAAAGSEAFAPAHAGLLGPETRGFVDRDADPRAACGYLVAALDPSGRELRFGPYGYDGAGAPLRLALLHDGANPFRGAALLTYTLPGGSQRARLAIYSVGGRLLRTLVQGEAVAGVWTAAWDGRDAQGRELPSGIYFGRLEAGAQQRTVKLTLLR